MSYLIRCDVCGKEFCEDDNETNYRVEVYFESSNYHAYTRHICDGCYPDFERFIDVLRKRKEE